MAISAPRLLALLASVSMFAGTALPAHAEGEVNIYSSRHYDTDERLYNDFTDATGIKVNLIEAKDDELIERLKAEGANSPADVFITVDAQAASGAPTRPDCWLRCSRRCLQSAFPKHCVIPMATGSACRPAPA